MLALKLQSDLNRITSKSCRLYATDITRGENINQGGRFYSIETTLRNSTFRNDAIQIADKAAIHGANYQFVPTIKALVLTSATPHNGKRKKLDIKYDIKSPSKLFCLTRRV